jgi:hypothetical protein
MKAAFLTIVMVITFMQVSILTTYAEQSGDYTYTVSESKATITLYTGAGGAIKTPGTLGGYPVTTIGDSAFSKCNGLTSLIIPNSVTTIDVGAFFMCKNLTSVTISNSVTTIGRSAFNSCSAMTSLALGISVTTIDEQAFDGCRGLTSLTLPKSVTTIGKYAFYYCDGLISLLIPNSVSTIGDGAFSRCSKLTSAVIPNRLTSIGDSVFDNCYSLKSVTIGNGTTTIGKSMFSECDSLTSIVIPNSVTTIGDFAFNECPNLTIKGFSGSYAEDYAYYNSIPFESHYLTGNDDTTCIADYNNRFVYGIAPGTVSLDEFIVVADGYEISLPPPLNGFGTGNVVNIIKDGITVESYTLVIFGDVNGDGNISPLDALMALQASAILITLTKDRELAIDVNRDYVVNSLDALMILQFASGIITNFI